MATLNWKKGKLSDCPKVRCDDCGEKYPLTLRPGLVRLQGECPNCGSTRFRTRINA